MNERNALVSVIIPTYYRNDLLVDTLQSVQNQVYGPIEIIVVDDSGEANAQPVANDFPDIEFIALERNCGAQNARTVGARRANGQYIHFLDDDDRMLPEKLSRQVPVLQRTEQTGVVYTGIKHKGGRTTLPDPDGRGDVLQKALIFSLWPCMTSTMLIETELVEALLPFSDRGGAHDLEMMIQFADRTNFDYVDAPLLYKRINMSSLGHSMTASEARKRLIRAYSSLYANYPESVRKAALANTHETEAELRIKKEGWSLRAILSLLKYVFYTPNTGLAPLIKLLAGCFGRPGWTFLNWLDQAIDS